MNYPIALNPVLRRMALAALLCLACSGVMAAPGSAVVLPALTPTPSGEHHAGKVIWTDLVTPDLAVARHFYGTLFGWQFQDVEGDPNYSLALLNGEPVAGLFRKPLPAGATPPQPAWLTFLSVPDVDAALRAALADGGSVLSKARDYPRRGRQAVLADPDGASFGVMSARGGDPPDALAPVGDWIWSSLLVADPQRETTFYKATLGYEVFDLASEGEALHYILASDGYARAGLNAQPADSMHRHPHWLNFIRVEDAAKTAEQAVALGGRIQVPVRLDRHGGHLAVLADPSGAQFGVLEWTDTDTKQEPQ
jgi:hypothetical protein